jgi:hypothetical protein
LIVEVLEVEAIEEDFCSIPQAVIYLDSEDTPNLAELEGMETNSLVPVGQLKFRVDPGGPTLTHLRQTWAATEVDLKLKPATVALIDNDRFHLLVCLRGGQAREQLGSLHDRMEKELTAQNAPLLAAYQTEVDTYQAEQVAYTAAPDASRAGMQVPVAPQNPNLATAYSQPVVRFWQLLEQLYPERSTTRISEFREFQMKPGESMTNMVSRLQTFKLVLNQPKPTSVSKFLDAIWPKALAERVKDILRIKEMGPNLWTVKDVGDIAIRLEKAQGEESLWTSSHYSAGPSGVSNGSFSKSTNVTCYGCGKEGHIKRNCPTGTKKHKAKTKVRIAVAQSEKFANPKTNHTGGQICYNCNQPGHIKKDCPQRRHSDLTTLTT